MSASKTEPAAYEALRKPGHRQGDAYRDGRVDNDDISAQVIVDDEGALLLVRRGGNHETVAGIQVLFHRNIPTRPYWAMRAAMLTRLAGGWERRLLLPRFS